MVYIFGGVMMRVEGEFSFFVFMCKFADDDFA